MAVTPGIAVQVRQQAVHYLSPSPVVTSLSLRQAIRIKIPYTLALGVLDGAVDDYEPQVGFRTAPGHVLMR